MIGSGDYAVILGRAYRVGAGRGSPAVRLHRLIDDDARWCDLVPIGPPLVGPVVDIAEDRVVPWEQLSSLSSITVWWRGPGGFPVTEWDRDGSRVWVETLPDQPYGPHAEPSRAPEFLSRKDNSSRFEGWVDADQLYDRCEIELELDISVFRVPPASWPRDKSGRAKIPPTVTARHVRFDDTSKERPVR